MESKIITSEHFKPSPWSGGTTLELFIHPPGADYQQRNFQFRLSTATVETQKSDFTSLPGISRKLMVLAGKIAISHKDHYSRKLEKFEVDSFEGDWETSSFGKCTDFNLMTTGKTDGEIAGIVLENEQSLNCNIKENCDWVFIYVFSGKVRIDINNIIANLNKGDLLILNKPTSRNFEIIGLENSELVYSEINLR